MRLLAGLVIAVVLVALLHKHIKRTPWLYYIIAVALDILLIASSSLGLPPWFNEYVLFIFQSNNLAMGLFTVVMFTGVLGTHSNLKRTLRSVRAELSIIASILCIGHIVDYGQIYVIQFFTNISNMPLVRVFGTLVALLLVLLLIPLAITSINFIHSKMSQHVWKRLQRLAYLFYALIFVHILFYLLPPAIAGSMESVVSVVLYMVLGVVYLVMRLLRHREASHFE